ncbi:serine/threonine-protein kinase [Streptomyces sp. NPDC086549]|uniref:serine/threonine-protein kinase n=1 Tax=Streptomyces sp. NPDC086549 TaxID=3365752 RepID=UPI00382615DC
MSEGDSGRRVVDGRFELQARLGGGGMGTVWRAHDLLLHRSVAVKEVRPPDAGLAEYDPEGARTLRERVLREARALARVDHPNVVTIHHIVDGGGDTYPWIVMELVEGGSLADLLARGPMAPAEAARVGQGVLSALRAAHAAGVQHRDVKPANVLLRRDDRPVLTDFGIAAVRESTTLTATGAIIGTPDYMAPERISGGPGGPEADLWSLAMMLYVAVEGHHPLRRDTTLATLAAVLYEEVPPPARAGSLTDVLNRLLVKDPAARPDAGTVERMLAAAAEPAAEQGATSYPLAPPTPAAPYVTGTGTPAPGGVRPTVSDAVPPAREPKYAVPPAPPTTTPDALVTVGRTSGGPRRRTRSILIACSVVAAVVAGSLIRGMLTDDDHKGASGSPGATSPSRQGTSTATTPTPTPADDQASGKTTDLLTPAGIRKVLKAFKDATGRDTYGDFTVYPGYASAELMVAGSRTKYDDYTYYPDRGVEKGIINGSLSGTEPVSLKNFNWDALPSLLAQARKQLHVDKPTTRYLVVNPPDTTFDTPANMAVYLSNAYSQNGYLEADPHGKVTRTMPYDGG